MTDLRNGLIRYPDYSPDLFVERAEIATIHGYLKCLAEGRTIAVRAMAFQGEPGAGKTWLLRHLAETGLQGDGSRPKTGNALGDPARGGLPNVRSLYLGLQTWQDPPETAAKQIIVAMDHEIAGWAQLIRPTTELSGGDTAPLDDLSRWLEADVRSLLRDRDRVLVLLLDHTYECKWDFLRLLDKHVLGPLTAIPGVFTVLAGRGRPYPWDAPSLRGHMEPVELRPFDVEQTRQQLEKQLGRKFAQEEIERIYRLSGGYPRTNYALGLLGPERYQEAIGFELEDLLSAIPEHRRKELRECLEALCVLEAFRDEQIGPMLASYHQNSELNNLPLAEASRLRKELLTHGLIDWDADARPGMWRIHGRVQNLLRNWLQTDRDRKLWTRLHCKAYHLYIRWSEQYPNTRSQWLTNAEYHRKALADIGIQANDCPE